jgi:anaerobic selenocysteine-containing dehydrogenase
MLNVIVNAKLYDERFVDRWCYGFDQLVPHVQKYTPRWASEITGVPEDQIVDLARQYATTPAACINMGNAFDQTADSSSAVRSVAILMAITGHLDVPGGNIISGTAGNMPKIKPVHLRERYTPDMVKKLVGPEIPACFQPFIEGTSSAYYRCLDSVLTAKPYPVRAIIAPGTQPTVITRGPRRIVEALNRLEFFVVVDVMKNAAMPWADVVVPVATMYECDHPFEIGAGNWLMARNKVVEREGDYKSDYQFWLDLAVRMGYGKDFWGGSIEKCMDYQLENFGLTMEDLRKYPTGIVYQQKAADLGNFQELFSAKSPLLSGVPYLPQGKVAVYNTTLEDNGFSPLPEWVGPPESPSTTPELLTQYPLIFTDAHTSEVYNAGWLQNVPYLREIQPDPWLHIHPDTANSLGIEDGDWVIVESPHGSIRLRAQHFPGIRPDTVMGLQGWWRGCDELGLPEHALLEGGASTNNLYSTDREKAFDPLVTAMPKQTLVNVRRAPCPQGKGSVTT